MDASDLRAAYGGARVSHQRVTIAETASRLGGAFSVDSLCSAVRERDDSIGVATVYRAVAALLESRWIERVGERAGSALFARCEGGAHHHHHVVCDGCGRIEVAECPVAVAPESPSGGFVVTRHEVTLYGLCPACAARTRERA